MRKRTMTVWAIGMLAAASLAWAQGPGRGPGPGPGGFPQGSSETPEEFAARMLVFDKDGDGKIAKAELTDARLQRLFGRADADGDEVVTREELIDLATKAQADDRNAPPGFGPPGGFGPGGPMIGMGRPGEILPRPLRRELNLTDEQARQIDALQKEVDERLAKILDEDQARTLQSLRERPPGPGFGPGPGGPGRGPGPGGPGRGPGPDQ